ncbi:MAG TPA: four helix bundle protein [Gemmatimonadaceae bacterium]|nr:four helix bundle protein [Gemmatimonadaceae bacterium]
MIDSDDDSGALDRVQAYQLAIALSDDAWDDAVTMRKEPLLAGHAEQMFRAVGDISAAIAEGYGRRSPLDRVRYYEYAMTSAEEARTWYRTGHRGLAAETLQRRRTQLVSIRRLLLTMMRNDRARTRKKRDE